MASKKKFSLKEHHPFAQGLLENFQQIPGAFANQSEELKKLRRYSSRSRIVGVLGELGSGKTTLLRHFCNEVLLPTSPVIYLTLSRHAEARPFSQIAIALLQMCSKRKVKGKIQITGLGQMNFDEERLKLESSLQKEVGLTLQVAPELKVSNLLEAKVGSMIKGNRQTLTYQQQDDSYAIALLQQLFYHSKTRFYIVLDDFHYLNEDVEGENYYDAFVHFAETVYSDLEYSTVTFFLTLDLLVLSKRRQAEAKGGGTAKKYTSEEVRVTGFTPKGIKELIDKRIELFDYSSENRPTFTDAGIIAISKSCRGNPRAALEILRRATDFAEDDDENTISLDHVIKAIRSEDVSSINDFEIDVLKYLYSKGPSSIVKEFWVAVKKSRPTLQRELPLLVEKGFISSRVAGTAKNPRKEFYIPPLHN